MGRTALEHLRALAIITQSSHTGRFAVANLSLA
jgi:hypothetical protein